MNSNNAGIVCFVLVTFLNLACGNDDDFQSCFRYTSFGYGYREIFEFHNAKVPSEYIFYFEFYVRTVSDAHVLLKRDVTGNDSVEIVIGGGSNTFSQIRLIKNEEKKTVFTQKTDNILSELNYKKFQISIDKEGIIFVRKENNIFLIWKLDDPFPVKYFAFGSWTNTKADWRFACDHQIEISQDESQLSPLQRLKKDLFAFYNPNTAPIETNQVLEVKVKFQIENARLNEKRGELKMHGYGVLKWKDSKLKWKPQDYDGIDHVYVAPFQIWTPYLRVLNGLAVDKTPLFDLTTTGVMVTHEGSILWRPPFKSVSSCEVDLTDWPEDTHNCSVLIGFWMEPPNLMLTIADEFEPMENAKAGSEWNVLGAISLNGKDDEDDDNYGILYVELERNQESKTLLLTTPCIVTEILSLSSFWLSLNDPNKFYLSCGALIMLLLTLLAIGQTIPIMTVGVPRIVTAYSWSIIIACFPILLFVFLKNIPKRIKLSRSIEKVINHRLMDRIFCLPELPLSSSEYGDLNEETNKMEEDRINTVRLVTVIERIFFLLYAFVLILRYALL